jgi:hypothetical protein
MRCESFVLYATICVGDGTLTITLADQTDRFGTLWFLSLLLDTNVVHAPEENGLARLRALQLGSTTFEHTRGFALLNFVRGGTRSERHGVFRERKRREAPALCLSSYQMSGA